MSEKNQNEGLDPKSSQNIIPLPGGAVAESISPFVEWICFLGSIVQIHLNRIKRSAIYHGENLFGAMFEGISGFFKGIWGNIKQTKQYFVDLFKKASYKTKKNKAQVLAVKGNEKSLAVRAEISFYGAQEYSVVAGKLFAWIFNYIMPVAAVALLAFTIQFFSTLNYGVEVSLRDQSGEYVSLGYIKNESLYDSAEKMMQQRIYYQNEEEALYTNPFFQVAIVSNDSFLTADQLSDRIIELTTDEITEGYGLYVGNQFLGAVSQEDQERLSVSINDILNRYRTGTEGERLNFNQEVELRKGLYLNTSIKPVDDMMAVIGSNQVESETYEVQSGDTLSGIAVKLDIPSAEINAMNPGLEETGLKPGQLLLVQVEKPFIDVTRTVTEQYEAEIPYQTIEQENASVYRGNSSKKQAGKNGSAIYTDEVVYQNGVEISRNTLGRQVLVEEVNEIIVRGTKDYPTVNTAGSGTKSADGSSVGSGNFINPVASYGHVTCGYLGYAGHTGIDLQSFYGDKILAADKGQVVKVVYGKTGYGYHVIIDHGNGMQTLYAHNSAIYVSVGDYVSQGQVIAAQGQTGRATGVHCHFEIRINGSAVNPAPYIPL